ncbi:MAG: hypothetical protein OHK0017_11160 [Patescibacteria group bacterium]
MKSQNKTQPTTIKVEDFLNQIENEQKRQDSLDLVSIMTEITGCQPQMWGSSIIGFGSYHYKYESGREGDSIITGFSPRKDNLVLYIMPGYLDLHEKLDRLGKHKIGKSCLYIKRLSDVNIEVLKEIVKFGVEYIHQKYQAN